MRTIALGAVVAVAAVVVEIVVAEEFEIVVAGAVDAQRKHMPPRLSAEESYASLPLYG